MSVERQKREKFQNLFEKNKIEMYNTNNWVLRSHLITYVQVYVV